MKWCSEVLFVRYLNIGTAAGTQPSPPSHPHTAATSLDLEVVCAGAECLCLCILPAATLKSSRDLKERGGNTMSGIDLGSKTIILGVNAEACFLHKC